MGKKIVKKYAELMHQVQQTTGRKERKNVKKIFQNFANR